MRLFSNIVIVAVAVVALGSTVARGDGGRVAIVERQRDYLISVFTSPNPLRAGPVDISVLLQDAETNEPVTDASVSVNLAFRESPAHRIRATATRTAATNKLMLSALVELPVPGWWDVQVICHTDRGTLPVQFAMEAGRPLPRWLSVWPWFSWPIGAVLLFGVHRLLVRRRHCQHSISLTGAAGSDAVSSILRCEAAQTIRTAEAGSVRMVRL